jgi:hypothetical protein
MGIWTLWEVVKRAAVTEYSFIFLGRSKPTLRISWGSERVWSYEHPWFQLLPVAAPPLLLRLSPSTAELVLEQAQIHDQSQRPAAALPTSGSRTKMIWHHRKPFCLAWWSVLSGLHSPVSCRTHEVDSLLMNLKFWFTAVARLTRHRNSSPASEGAWWKHLWDTDGLSCGWLRLVTLLAALFFFFFSPKKKRAKTRRERGYWAV